LREVGDEGVPLTHGAGASAARARAGRRGPQVSGSREGKAGCRRRAGWAVMQVGFSLRLRGGRGVKPAWVGPAAIVGPEQGGRRKKRAFLFISE